MLSACFSDDQNSKQIAGDSTANRKPTVSGDPPSSIRAGQVYEFTPQASDPDGDKLKFRVSNKPSWANFDEATGRLWGTPRDADVGINLDIKIAVTDGRKSAVLPRFAITVDQISNGSVTLSWNPPIQNADGSALTDLAGYRIYYGTSSGKYSEEVLLDSPGLTSYVIDNLAPGTYFLVMTSINSRDIESKPTPELKFEIGT